ncbi:FkbM family methyltransferase [Calothrix sp. PCC 7507]|uniref:FkbM family methyltransferase n=1 Tax=Calothrix sp. PCC 7507 TaxID=99598 RepID=UPI00029F1EA0|nr:FkbM family methyltransferase [Calothrix sp. PCC 7507]AFY34227.1 methyltransferase FkbM family [Calothrix sp. PCC 7507]
MAKLLPENFFIQKLEHYLREISLCFRMGANFNSGLRLAIATLKFHINNVLNIAQSANHLPPKSYQIQFGDYCTDLWLRTYTGDIFVLHEIFLECCYQIPKIWLQEASSIIDLGANIGITTLFFRAYFPNAKYVLVEPSTTNLSVLRRNISWLEKCNQAQVIAGAVSNYSGELRFSNTQWSWGGYIDPDSSEETIVRSYTMTEIIELSGLNKIDILKVDIEGAEKQLFSQPNEWLKNVKIIIAELHNQYSIEQFQKDLEPMGFTVIPPNPKYGNRMICALSPEVLNNQKELTTSR